MKTRGSRNLHRKPTNFRIINHFERLLYENERNRLLRSISRLEFHIWITLR